MDFRNKAYNLIKIIYMMIEWTVVISMSVYFVITTGDLAIDLIKVRYIYTIFGLLLFAMVLIFTAFIFKALLGYYRRFDDDSEHNSK